jgi:hypothetical protein
MLSRKTTQEFSLEQIKTLIVKELQIDEAKNKVTLEVVMTETGDERFGPTSKSANGIKISVESI